LGKIGQLKISLEITLVQLIDKNGRSSLTPKNSLQKINFSSFFSQIFLPSKSIQVNEKFEIGLEERSSIRIHCEF